MTGGHDHDGHDDHVHGGGDSRRVLIAACLTGGFMVAEVIGGILVGSLALLADAGHMLVDSASLFLALFAFRMAERPATRRHSYGFDRMKTVAAYTNGVAMIVVVVWIAIEAVTRLRDPVPVLGGPMLVVAVVGLLVNVAAFLVLHGGDRDSLNMRGAIVHVFGDLLGSVAAIAAAIVILTTGFMPIDPILSLLVAALILRSAWSITRDALHVLLEGAPRDVDRAAIERELEAIAGVRDIHHVHIWSLDGTTKLATLHAVADAHTDADALIGAIKAHLAKSHGIGHTTVQIEGSRCREARGHEKVTDHAE